MKNFRALKTLTIYLNISRLKVLIQIALCRNARIQMNLSKNNRLSAEEAKIIFLAPRNEKKCQDVKCLNPLGFCPPHASNFTMETEDNSIQTQLYNSSII